MSPIMSIPRPLDVVSAGGGFLCGGYLPFNRVLAKPWGWRAIFIAPTEGFAFTIQRPSALG